MNSQSPLQRIGLTADQVRELSLKLFGEPKSSYRTRAEIRAPKIKVFTPVDGDAGLKELLKGKV